MSSAHPLKVCASSSQLCSEFGLGSSGKGIFEFFLFFAFSLLLLLLLLGLANLWFTGHVPTVIKLAREHAMSPSDIIRKVVYYSLFAPTQSGIEP